MKEQAQYFRRFNKFVKKTNMKTLHFSIDIAAPRKKVWKTLWDDATYREWTSVFSEGSFAESDWKEGSKILFLDPSRNGMSSIIEKSIPDTEMKFRHVTEVKDGKEVPAEGKIKEWSGATESYFLEGGEGVTKLKVELETTDEYADHFKDIFPKGLQKVKELSEKI
jgi:hypothetical protein